MESFANYDFKAVLHAELKTVFYVQKIVMITKGFYAIDLHPSLGSHVFPFVCAFGFAFPSSAGRAVARTSDCLDECYHRWWKVCRLMDSF